MSSMLGYVAEAESLLNCKTKPSDNEATQSTLRSGNHQQANHPLSDILVVWPGGSNIDEYASFLEKALGLLRDIHREAVSAEKDANELDGVPFSLADPRYRKVIAGLLDVVVLQGICPFLSPGVGTPYEQRVRVTTYNAVRRSTPQPRISLGILSKVIDYLLCDISESAGIGVEPFIRDRILPDVVCGAAELAYSPDWDTCANEERDVIRRKFRPILKSFLDTTSTHSVLPTLTSLIQPPAPAWLRVAFVEYLSTVPLRVNGVRNVIDFVAYSSSKQPAPMEQSSQSSPERLLLTTDALTQVSRLLCSPPSTTDADIYFSALAVQLYFLLDGEAGPDMAKAAGRIIGSGILGRKSLGASGAVGWRLFAQPLLDIINPSIQNIRIDSIAKSKQDAVLDSPLSSEPKLSQALQRLLTIVETTRNVGLTRRLFSSLYLSIWGLHNYAAQRCPNTIWSGTTWNILEIYSSRCASAKQLSEISSNLLWNGPSSWTYGPGSLGGIEIRRRTLQDDLANDPTNIIDIMGSVDQRATTFTKLLETTVDDDTISNIFLHVSRRWLLPRSSQGALHILDEDSENPLDSLISATLVKAMFERLQHRISKSYDHVLQLVKQILGEYVDVQRNEQEERKDQQRPSYKGLRNIAQVNNTNNKSVGLQEDDGSIEVVSISLSLLNAILNTIDGPLSPEIPAILVSFKTDLTFLSQTSSIPTSICSTAQDLLSIISLLVSPPLVSNIPTFPLPIPQHDSLSRDRQTHQSTLTSLSDSHPAIRAEGLHHLGTLISNHSPVIDPMTTTHLLLPVLRDPEEYVYLSAIRTLVLLVAQNPRTVLQVLLDAYADRRENRGLDERLRIGEAIGKCVDALVQDSAVAITGEAPRLVAEALIGVAGRRGTRAKEAQDREMKREKADGEARKAWGGEVPVLSDLLSQEDYESKEDDITNDALAKILEGWEGTGGEEDVRMRTSAVSLLGKIVESYPTALDDAMLAVSLDLATFILKLEIGSEKAILRRAAVLCMMGLVNNLDAVWCQGKGKGLQHVVGRLDGVESVLRYARDVDADELVREQAAVVLGEVEELRMKVVLGLDGPERGTAELVGLRPTLGGAVGMLAGLDVIPDVSGDGGRGEGRVLVEEVEE